MEVVKTRVPSFADKSTGESKKKNPYNNRIDLKK